MPTGPFASLGKWNVFEHDGSVPKTGPSATITIVKATRKWIKYTRKCSRNDPLGKRIQHGKVYRCWNTKTFRVSVGGFQHVQTTT